MSDGDGRKALREYLARELATASRELAEGPPSAIPPTYDGRCHCGSPFWRDEKLCRKHAKERLAALGIVAR